MFRIALALALAINVFAGQSSDSSAAGDISGNLLRRLQISPAQRSILEEKLTKRDYSGAEDLLADEARRDPKSPAILLVLAHVLFLDGRHLNCIVVLKKAEKLESLDEKNRLLLALACVAAGHLNWARPEFEKLAAQNPANPVYPYWLGRIAYRKTDINTAITQARKAIGLDPSFMKAYDQLGLYYEAAGYSDEAIAAFREAIHLNNQAAKKSPWPMLNLGVLMMRVDRLDEAEAELRASIEADDSFPPAHYRLGQVLEKKQLLADAKAELGRAASLDPTYPDPHYALARIYRRTGDPKAAAKELVEFQELRETDKRKGTVRPD
jgi:tetratricopeptide (TPR) repeat protein